MEKYVGKICPYCKAEIKEDDEVKVCPSCDIAHHAACWIENNGCTTFGCTSHYETETENSAPQNQVPQQVVSGTSKCIKCGTDLFAGQEFCPVCGQKQNLQIDAAVNDAINKFNNELSQKKNKSKNKPKIIAAIIAVILVIGIIAGVAISSSNKKKEEERAEKAKEEYITNAEEFLELTMNAGTNLEVISDRVQKYWYENIWYDKHGYDINSAIAYAMIDSEEELEKAEDYNEKVNDLYEKIKDVPEAISDDDEKEIKEICDAVNELYDVYVDFYAFATNPEGSYNSFSEDNGDYKEEYIDSYKALNNLLD